MEKLRQVFVGIIIGVVATISATTLANTTHISVKAWLVDNVQFIFNGEYKSVPDEYGGVLIYNDRAYVPTRFIVENIGAEVEWDEVSRTATIKSVQCPICSEESEDEQDQHKEDSTDRDKQKLNESQKEPSQPTGSYRKLPISKYLQDQEITVTSVIRSGDFNNIHAEHKTHTRVYIRVENKGTKPIQLQHSKTIAIIDGKEYKSEGMPTYQVDDKWYHDLYEEDIIEGYIGLPLIPEDSKEMKLKLYIVENSWEPREIEVEFDIALDLN